MKINFSVQMLAFANGWFVAVAEKGWDGDKNKVNGRTDEGWGVCVW